MIDPYQTLDTSRDSDDEAIRKAYLVAIRACPADRNPERFKLIQSAFEMISTVRKRVAYELFGIPEPTTMDLQLQIDAASTAKGRPSEAQFRATLAATAFRVASPVPGGGDHDVQ